jgi:hypothetical protein
LSHLVVAPANTDFFSVWFLRTQDLCNIMSTEVITANTAALGAITVGNGFVTGIFGATVLTGNVIQGGVVGTPATLNVNSNISYNAGFGTTWNGNAAVNSSVIFVGNSTVNAFINSSSLSIAGQVLTSALISSLSSGGGINVTTAGLSAANIDFFTRASARSAEYLLTVSDTAANNYHMAKLLMIFDGTNALITEYGQITTNTSIGTWSAGSNATHVVLVYTPTTTGSTIKGFKSVVPL